MDQVAADICMTDWTSIVQQCQNRPEGQIAKQQLEEKSIGVLAVKQVLFSEVYSLPYLDSYLASISAREIFS